MGRFWSLLFLLVPILGVGAFVWAIAGWYPLAGHWLPENVNSYGVVIDNLFMFILYLTGVIFVATSLALFWFLWKYDAAKNPEPVKYTHGDHTLEVVWSIIPAATLLFIAIYQMNAWADHKMRRPLDPGPDGVLNTPDDPMELGPDGKTMVHKAKRPLAEVTGRQFEWRIRYAGKDMDLGTKDDVFVVNDLHVPVDEDVVLEIKAADVLHSFFIPNFRLKQDVIPGMDQFVWFHPTKTGVYDIVCAELCGWGHYKMGGRITIESRPDYEKWLAEKYAEQERTTFAKPKTEGTAP